MNVHLKTVLCACAVSIASASALAQYAMYGIRTTSPGVNTDSTLFGVSPIGGGATATTVGSIGYWGLDIAITPSLDLWSVGQTAGQIRRHSITTGATLQTVAISGLPANNNSLEALDDNTLFAWGYSGDAMRLQQINLLTQTATFITGPTSAAAAGGDLALDPTDSNALYGITTSDQLIRFDISGASWSVVGSLPSAPLWTGLDFDHATGKLYAFTYSESSGSGLYEINKSTAAATWLAWPGGTEYLGMATVPEPHEYAMLAGLGLLGFAVYRRRMKA
ncbi:MAG: hypothetical protein FJ387_17570 [Verrucomicrobia bacterium]|nr:hypothetical protein [Verrucomicrobiota bacterium]